MILTKQDIEIWVDVNDRTQNVEPKINHIIKFEDGEVGSIFDDLPFKIITHWLKPIKQVYVLTEQEIEDLKFQEYNKGYEKGLSTGAIPF